MTRLFIVDDDVLTCELLRTITQSLFRVVKVYLSGQEFITQHLEVDDVVLLDLMMPEFDGIEVMRSMADKTCHAKLVLMSGYDLGVLHSAERLAHDYGLKVIGSLTKPISPTDLTRLLSPFSIKSNDRTTTIAEQNIEKNTEQNTEQKNYAAEFIPSYNEIMQAINNHQFILYYQPQILIKNNQLIGVEALVRWQHPEHGLVSPDKFIAIAEQSGAITPLTEEILAIAIQQCVQWKNQKLMIKVSVNLSAQNINSLQLPEQLSVLVKNNHLDPSMLVLEVTESALMGNLTSSLDILTRLRLKGFQLSIDDFGTGFSSLSQLHKIPFTELKIDQSFVAKIIDDAECHAIVETCVMLGQKLNMEVVAEGIENKEVLASLAQMGCDIAQGYFFAKPMPAAELIRWQKNNLSQHIARA